MKIGRSENLFENRSSHFHTVHLAFTRYVRDLPHSQFSPFWFCERFWKLPMSYSNLEYFGFGKDVLNCGQSWDLGPVRCGSASSENSRFWPVHRLFYSLWTALRLSLEPLSHRAFSLYEIRMGSSPISIFPNLVLWKIPKTFKVIFKFGVFWIWRRCFKLQIKLRSRCDSVGR